jgi:thymidylate kinase
MKFTVTVVAAAVLVAVQLFPGLTVAALLVPSAVHLVYGVARSSRRKLDPLNEVPNSFRTLLASSAGVLPHFAPNFLGVAIGIASFVAAVLLNDEYQRRALSSFRKGAKGGSVALLGIDGSGKSTHAAELESWFAGRGYFSSRVPFHRYLFVERLSRVRPGGGETRGSRRGGHPLRPLASAIDNILLYLISSFGRGLEGRIVLYDRYIWSTLVKYEALGYPVSPVKWAYMLPSPKFALVLDIPVSKSQAVIASRADHIRYPGEVLAAERAEYLRIARERRLPVVDASRSYKEVQGEIEALLSRVFPPVGVVA